MCYRERDHGTEFGSAAARRFEGDGDWECGTSVDDSEERIRDQGQTGCDDRQRSLCAVM